MKGQILTKLVQLKLQLGDVAYSKLPVRITLDLEGIAHWRIGQATNELAQGACGEAYEEMRTDGLYGILRHGKDHCTVCDSLSAEEVLRLQAEEVEL